MAANIGAGTAFYWSMPNFGGTPTSLTFVTWRVYLANYFSDVDALIATMTIDVSYVQVPNMVLWATSTAGPAFIPGAPTASDILTATTIPMENATDMLGQP